MRRGLKLPTGQPEEVYRRINKCITLYCGLIFNFSATLEWAAGRATEKSTREIADVVDSAKVKYIVEGDYLVYTREILGQCHKQYPNIQIPDLPLVLQNISDNSTFCSAYAILVTQVSDYLEKDEIQQIRKRGGFTTTIKVVSVKDFAKESFYAIQENAKKHHEGIQGFRESLSEDIARKDEYFSDPQKYRKRWMKRFLKIDRILRAFNPQIDIDDILDTIDITKCPAVSLSWTVREKRMKSAIPPKDDDVGDYMFLGVVPYADIVLTERNLRAFILQADKSLESKVFSKGSDALNALESYGFAW